MHSRCRRWDSLGQTETPWTAAGVAAPPSKPDAMAHRRQPPGGTIGAVRQDYPRKQPPRPAALVAEMGRFCCKSLPARFVQISQGLGGAHRKNAWGTTQTTAHSTSDLRNRATIALISTFSSRRVSCRFSSPFIFRLLQQNRPGPDVSKCRKFSKYRLATRRSETHRERRRGRRFRAARTALSSALTLRLGQSPKQVNRSACDWNHAIRQSSSQIEAVNLAGVLTVGGQPCITEV